MSPGRDTPCPDEVERRLDMAREIHDLRLQQAAELHELKLELEKAKVRGTENGNGNGKKTHPLLQWIGVPGALLAVATILVLYHTNVAMPAVRTAAREAVAEMLKSTSFWAEVRLVSREESVREDLRITDMRNKQLADLQERLDVVERKTEENTRTLDSKFGARGR